MKYIKGLDSIRAIAVIFVILGHWSFPLGSKEFMHWFKSIIPHAGYGVNLFFVLSGFLITGILLKARENSSKKLIFKNFYIRRTLRIIPIYYLVVAVFYLIGFPFVDGSMSSILSYTSNFRIYNERQFFPFSYSWSLAVEEQFYIIWPLLIVFVRKSFLKYLFPTTILIGLVYNYYTVEVIGNWAGQFIVISCFQAFGLGGWYAYLRNENKDIKINNWLRLIFMVGLMFLFHWNFYPKSKNNYLFLITLVYSIVSIGVIYLTVENKSEYWKKYFFENRVLNYIGRISYGIYLLHGGMHYIFENLIKVLPISDIQTLNWLNNWKNSYFIKLALLLIIAHLSFRYIETPLLNLKKKFEYK